MRKILPPQKLILIIFTVVFLQLFFLIGKNAPVAYGASPVGEILYHEWGYFLAGNGILGGPGCGICVQEARSSKNSPWHCVSLRLGIKEYFTKDSACKTAYGSNVIAGSNIGKYNSQVRICGLTTTEFDKIECIIPMASPCAQLKDGVCLKIDTPLSSGGISSDPSQFITKIMTIILGLAGGIALLLIISAGYKIMASKGKPETIQQGKDQLISAIVGLVFIIFSFVIFQLIMVDILKIPNIN